MFPLGARPTGYGLTSVCPVDRPVARARLLLPVLLAGLLQVVGSFGAATRQPSARPVDTFAVALLLAGPALLLLRRRFPAAALAGTSAAVLGYLGAGYPFGPVPLRSRSRCSARCCTVDGAAPWSSPGSPTWGWSESCGCASAHPGSGCCPAWPPG